MNKQYCILGYLFKQQDELLKKIPLKRKRPTQYEQRNHRFYSNTVLKNSRMKKISDWLGTLSEDNKKMIQELIDDGIAQYQAIEELER